MRHLWRYLAAGWLLLLATTYVYAQPTSNIRICTDTSCVNNNGAELNLQVVAGGNTEGVWSASGLYRSLGLGVGPTTQISSQSCIGRATNDRLFADRDCDDPPTQDAGEDYIDGRTGVATFSFAEAEEVDVITDLCLWWDGSGFVSDHWSVGEENPLNCSTNNKFLETVYLFPSSLTVTAQHIACGFRGTGLTVSQSVDFKVLWRNWATQTVQQESSLAVSVTVGTSGAHINSAALSSPGSEETCPYSQCALAVKIDAETLTAGTDISGHCTVFYEISG